MFCRKCGTELHDDSLFCNKCGENLGASMTSEVSHVTEQLSSNSDKLNTKDTTEYLEVVSKLENNKFALNRTRDTLTNKINTLGVRRNIPKPKYKSASIFWLIPLAIAWFVGLTMIIVPGDFVRKVIGILLFAIPSLPVVYIIIANTKIRQKYKNEINDDIQRAEAEKKRIPIYKNHIIEIDKDIKEIDISLNDLYSLNIIYSKYRNDIVAVNSFYEYFISGRVYSLAASRSSGNDGAYNLYENELRLDRITNKLDVIINQLEQIKENQYMLYNAIQEANSMAFEISRMADKISAVADNTSMTAYNAKITADNSSAIKFMNLWK